MTSNLNERQQLRWEAARSLFQRLKDTAVEEKCQIMFDGAVIQPDAIEITDTRIHVHFERATYIMFEADPERDHGLYDRISDYETQMRERFQLFYTVPF